jgi:hypothetical protein
MRRKASTFSAHKSHQEDLERSALEDLETTTMIALTVASRELVEATFQAVLASRRAAN